MDKSEIPEGSILRFRKWVARRTGGPNTLRKGQVMWGRADYSDGNWFEPVLDKIGSRIKERNDCTARTWDLDHKDIFDIVPEEDVPGEVYAYFVKQVLLGDAA